ncbi:MAG: hypothetical protein ABI142_06570 [Bryocella sp.]
MQLRGIVSVCVAIVAMGAQAEKPRLAPPPQPAASYAMHDAHAAERVTIAAEPCDTAQLTPKFRLKYFEKEMLPIRVIVTNDSDEAVNLDDARIHFIAADGTVVPAATDEELDRRLFTMKSATGTRLPLGLPIPITVGKKNVNKLITQDENDFGFATTTVAPHTTVAGYLFYDMEGLDRPLLAHATLELRKVRWAKDNRPLESFEIALKSSKGSE